MEYEDFPNYEVMEFEVDRELLKKLDNLVAKGVYPSRQQAMCTALMEIVSEHKDIAHERPAVVKVDVRIPTDLKAQVDELIYLKVFPDHNNLMEKSLKNLLGESLD